VRFLASEQRVYVYAIDQYNTPARTGISHSELVQASTDLRNYFNNDAEYFFARVTQGGKEVSLFNERETLHLHDIKGLFHWVNVIQEIAIIYAMAYVIGVFVWARERSLRTLAAHTLSGSLLTIGIVVVLAVFALAGFDRIFEQFHHIVFKNNYWQMRATDHLVQMFPDGFWFDMTMFLGILTLAEAAILSVAATVHLTVTWRAHKHALLPSQQAAH